jgi:hypothetical protein
VLFYRSLIIAMCVTAVIIAHPAWSQESIQSTTDDQAAPSEEMDTSTEAETTPVDDEASASPDNTEFETSPGTDTATPPEVDISPSDEAQRNEAVEPSGAATASESAVSSEEAPPSTERVAAPSPETTSTLPASDAVPERKLQEDDAQPVSASKPRGARSQSVRLAFGRVIGSAGTQEFSHGEKVNINGLEAFLFVFSTVGIEYLPISYLGIEALFQSTAYRKNGEEYGSHTKGFSGRICLSKGLLLTVHPLKEHWLDPYFGGGVKLATYWYNWDNRVKDFSTGAMMKLGGNLFVTSWFFIGISYEFSHNKFEEISMFETMTRETVWEGSSSSTSTTTGVRRYYGSRLIDNRFNLLFGFAI